MNAVFKFKCALRLAKGQRLEAGDIIFKCTYVFSMLKTVRRTLNHSETRVSSARIDTTTRRSAGNDDSSIDGPCSGSNDPDDTPSNGSIVEDIASNGLKQAILKEWEHTMSVEQLTQLVCAVCARMVDREKIVIVNPTKINLRLLQNNDLPSHLRPTSYAFDIYDQAILHPRDLQICKECSRDLKKRQRMPKYALANWLYYAYDRLPANIQTAFKEATWTEKVLISRARASRISFRFSSKPGHQLYGSDPRASQRYTRGNVAIHPQDATHLNDVLPPSTEVVRDMICAVFISGHAKVTEDTIRDLQPEPMLARKSRLKCMIDFLLSSNSHYAPGGQFRGYSQQNMDALFDREALTTDACIPCGIEIGYAATSGYVPGEDTEPPEGSPGILMDSIGYLHSDETPLNTTQMKVHALKHCLSGGNFVQSRAGSQFIADFENPSLLTWLYPYLDPWGIGGFFEPRRTRPLTLDEQLKYLLTVYPDFAFREHIVGQLLALNLTTLDALYEKYKHNPSYHPESQEEKEMLALLARVNAISHDLPGTNGYKTALRNQIRSLINYKGTPTLFVTLNPSDIHNPIVALLAGQEVTVEQATRGEELARWQRKLIAAQNPDACARFFHKIISGFIHTVLRYGRPGRGLFGKFEWISTATARN
ncbi:hypothetical protein C8Q76DRAFT_766005 [Earliella scabrosa]|nr:hypothetical protein C8Q76DRAFT_766005 [Earliella scabrosa]